MPLSVEIGLVLALRTAFGSVAGFLCKFRGAREAPTVELLHPLRSTVELFRSPVYALGIVIAFASWGVHVGALALAPISLVQSVIAGGLVLLTVVADRPNEDRQRARRVARMSAARRARWRSSLGRS